jgi:hypothetical protein
MEQDGTNLRVPEPVEKRLRTILFPQVNKKQFWMVLSAAIVELLRLPPAERLDRYGAIANLRTANRLEEFMAQFDHPPASGPQIAHVNTPTVKGGSENTERTGSLDVPRLPPEKKGQQSPRKRFPAS